MNQKFMERHQVEAKAEEQRKKKGRKGCQQKKDNAQKKKDIKKIIWVSGVVSKANPQLAPFFFLILVRACVPWPPVPYLKLANGKATLCQC
jgi:hypothetical protein